MDFGSCPSSLVLYDRQTPLPARDLFIGCWHYRQQSSGQLPERSFTRPHPTDYVSLQFLAEKPKTAAITMANFIARIQDDELFFSRKWKEKQCVSLHSCWSLGAFIQERYLPTEARHTANGICTEGLARNYLAPCWGNECLKNLAASFCNANHERVVWEISSRQSLVLTKSLD